MRTLCIATTQPRQLIFNQTGVRSKLPVEQRVLPVPSCHITDGYGVHHEELGGHSIQHVAPTKLGGLELLDGLRQRLWGGRMGAGSRIEARPLLVLDPPIPGYQRQCCQYVFNKN